MTIQQQSVFDLSIIKAHSESTEYATSDKQRRESALHCEGLMSLLCGNSESGEIIRLDRDVQWTLQPKKKEYLETPFLSAAQRLDLQQQASATLEKMKQCPAKPQQTAPGPDQSKCQMSPPQFNVQQTELHATFADSSSGVPTNLGSAATAIGSKLGSLFGKTKAAEAADPSTPAAPPLPPGMTQAAQFSVETKSITAGPVTPDEFEIPAGWKLVQPAQTKSAKEFSCPQT